MHLKILHVGNVAQNGYINALILRARGHDCDIVAPDLYHVACSPEWYGADFDKTQMSKLGDDLFFPDFYALGRDMPKVGDWVAHGPFMAAITYLILKRRRDPLARLAYSTLAYLRFKATVMRTTSPAAVRISDAVFAGHMARYDLTPALRRHLEIGRMAERYSDWILSRVSAHLPPEMVSSWSPPLSRGAFDHRFADDPLLASVMEGLRRRGLARALGLEFEGPATEFGDLEARGFEAVELMPYAWIGRALRELSSFYDLCIFYGDSGKYAYVAGISRYWALEHGTIRTIPFEQTIDGRLTAAAYLNADRVLLTNTDYATATRRLEFSPDQRVYAPHPFDEAPAIAFRERHLRRRDPDRAIFLCPARQDWRSRNPKMAKGNDLYFQAGRLLLDTGQDAFTFHCIDWGVDRDASRELVARLGLDAHVVWLPMMSKRELWAAKLDAHAVIDQFLVSALGGVSFETLALGCRLISRDDGINNAVFFAEAPPILAASTPEEIASWMTAVIDDPDDLAGRGERAASWIVAHHSADRMHDLQMSAFRGSASTPVGRSLSDRERS